MIKYTEEEIRAKKWALDKKKFLEETPGTLSHRSFVQATGLLESDIDKIRESGGLSPVFSRERVRDVVFNIRRSQFGLDGSVGQGLIENKLLGQLSVAKSNVELSERFSKVAKAQVDRMPFLKPTGSDSLLKRVAEKEAEFREGVIAARSAELKEERRVKAEKPKSLLSAGALVIGILAVVVAWSILGK